MKLFETIESKWQHHCDAGMAEMLNYLAGEEGDEVVTTKRRLYEEVNRRCPYAGVIISDRTIHKNLDLLISLKMITIETTGGKLGKTIIRRGTGRGTQKKKSEIDFDLLVRWYNDNIAIGGRAKWFRVTAAEKKNIKKCQTIANARNTTIGATLSKVTASSYLMSWQSLGHYWIFLEDNFIKILDGTYDDRAATTTTTATIPTAVTTSAGIAEKADRRLQDRINALRGKQGGQGQE